MNSQIMSVDGVNEETDSDRKIITVEFQHKKTLFELSIGIDPDLVKHKASLEKFKKFPNCVILT